MIKIGIDFSIKSPAVCLKDSKGNLTFLSYPRKSLAKEDFIRTLVDSGVIVNVIPDEPALPKKSSIGERERSSLLDADVEISTILETVKCLWTRDTLLENHEYTIHVGIEGFSFGSTGNRLAQLSGYQWVLRYMMYKDIKMKPENFYVYAPMTVKATAGKGNFKKEDMIAAFVQSVDPKLRETKFWQRLNEAPAEFQTKKGKWLRPIDDIVDAYWVLRTLEKGISELSNE
jgi:hypothetical protein